MLPGAQSAAECAVWVVVGRHGLRAGRVLCGEAKHLDVRERVGPERRDFSFVGMTRVSWADSSHGHGAAAASRGSVQGRRVEFGEVAAAAFVVGDTLAEDPEHEEGGGR